MSEVVATPAAPPPPAARPAPPRRVRGARLPWRLIARRLVALPFLLLLVATVAFLIFHALPGDPARTIAGPYADEAAVAAVRGELGLDQPLPQAYGDFLSGLVRGDLGTSYFSQNPVTHEIGERLPATIELMAASILFAFVWGAVLGATGAYWRGRAVDRVGRGLVGIQQAVPDFVVGLVLVYLLAYRAGILPQATGQLGLTTPEPPDVTGMVVVDALLAGQWGTFTEALSHLILPAIAQGLLLAAIYARVIRSRLGAALQGSQVEFARACGLRERTVLRYAAYGARTSVLTYTALLLGALFATSAVIETTFNWGGVAQWGIQSISELDIPAMQGFVILTGTATVLLYLVLDVLIVTLDPRVRLD